MEGSFWISDLQNGKGVHMFKGTKCEVVRYSIDRKRIWRVIDGGRVHCIGG